MRRLDRRLSSPWRRCAAVACLLVWATPSSRAQFTQNTTDIPSGPENAGCAENVDFGDVDNDGDWDVVLAKGGDNGDDQDRIWINQGGLQGGQIGHFVDETATRFPALATSGRDIELADIDADGDLDIHGAAHSSLRNQGNVFWINMGGAQGGAPGFFSDQTQSRWLNLGQAGSSVDPGLVLGSGGFVDWTGDSDFADLDNDGDLDVVHSSYGGHYSGDVPTRLFLNDGLGFFEEFNPSGFRLSGTDIQNGDPGLWAEGEQRHDTTDFQGTFCDIALTAHDTDVGDVDGDFDLDLVSDDRRGAPRMFRNLTSLPDTSLPPFRDVTNLLLPPCYAKGNGQYEQELADMDGDGDLDLYGVNWQSSGLFWDATLENDGAGAYFDVTQVADSSSDHTEADCFDYDGDGDLDVFLANFSGANGLLRNDTGAGPIVYTPVAGIPVDLQVSLDGESADVDADGDYDLFVANAFFGTSRYLQNDLPAGDTHAAAIPRLEQAADRVAGAHPTVVRAHVYDNAPYYVTWYNAVELEYSVDGGPFDSLPMRASGGQVFRGEIPGALSGSICYRVRSTDEHGNSGVSAKRCYDATCRAFDVYCTAKTNSCGALPQIAQCGAPSTSASAGFLISTDGARPNRVSLVLYGANGPAALPFDGGTLCVAPPFRRSVPTFSKGGAGGTCDARFEIDWNAFASGALGGNPASFLQTIGLRVHLQFWGRDTQAHGSLLSNGTSYVVAR